MYQSNTCTAGQTFIENVQKVLKYNKNFFRGQKVYNLPFLIGTFNDMINKKKKILTLVVSEMSGCEYSSIKNIKKNTIFSTESSPSPFVPGAGDDTITSKKAKDLIHY